MFARGVHRPIVLAQMLCVSESHKSIQGLEIVDVIATEAGGGWVGENVVGQWSCFTGHASPLSTCCC